MKNWFRKILLSIFGIGIAFAATATLLPTGQPIPSSHLLRTDKDNIVGSKQYVHRQKGRPDIVSIKYAYKASPLQDLPNEVVFARTKHSRRFTTDEVGVFITEIIAGVPQYYHDDSGNWFQADYATTTLNAFNAQTISWYEKILGQPVLASDGPFFPDADTESTSVDGDVASRSTVWDTVHDATSGTENARDNTVSNDVSTGFFTSISSWEIIRYIVLFDTSVLPDGDTISAANLQLFEEDTINNDNDTLDYLTVVQSSPASNTAIVQDDYDQVGNIDNPTEAIDAGSRIDYGSISAGAYNTFTFNATGIAFIDKAGITKLGVREGHDAEDMEYDNGLGGSTFNLFKLSAAETAGTTQDPKLTVTHSAIDTIINIKPGTTQFKPGTIQFK